jgi:anti-sigma factor RsiW
VTHDEVRELLAAYALDALDPEDERAVEAHLATCPDCRRDVAALREAAASLATGVPSVEPPAALKTRIMRATELEARVEPPAPVTPLPAGRPRNWSLAVAALAAALAVVLGGLNLSLNRS